jgi:hypothetical protein
MDMILHAHPVIAQYLDPGTGSYLFQLAIAGVTALLFFFSHRIKGSLSRFLKYLKRDNGTK